MSTSHSKTKALAGVVSAASLLAVAGQSANAASVIVKPGDTVWGLSQKYSVPASSIENANSIKKLGQQTDLIFVGQKLQVNSKKATPTRVNHVRTTTYTVKSGDTLSELSMLFGVSVQSLKTANHLHGDLISVGQKLTLVNPGRSIAQVESLQVVQAQAQAEQVAQAQAAVAAAQQAQQAKLAAEQQAAAQQAVAQQAAKEAATQQAAAKQQAAQQQATTEQAPVQKHTARVAPQQPTETVAVQASDATQTAQAAPAQATDSQASQQSANRPVAAQPAVQKTAVSSNQPAAQTPTKQQAVQTPAPAQTAKRQTTPSMTTQSTSTPVAGKQTVKVASAQQTVNKTQPTKAKPQATQTATVQTPKATKPSQSNLQTGSVTGLAVKLAGAHIPYVWGGSSLSGMDCSGLVAYVYKNAAGVDLPHYTVSQESRVNIHSVSSANPGDILFWGQKGASYHSAIYIGNNQYVAAPQPGQNVDIESISSYFMPSFAGTLK